MENLESVILQLDSILDSKRKRHIIGGALLSISMLFAGLAITAMTLNMEDDNE